MKSSDPGGIKRYEIGERFFQWRLNKKLMNLIKGGSPELREVAKRTLL
jgi:hypothetical protein